MTEAYMRDKMGETLGVSRATRSSQQNQPRNVFFDQ